MEMRRDILENNRQSYKTEKKKCFGEIETIIEVDEMIERSTFFSTVKADRRIIKESCGKSACKTMQLTDKNI